MNPETSFAEKIRNRFRAFSTTPDIVRERRKLGLRRFLFPILRLPIWVTTKCGAKIFLGGDPIDDEILEDVCGRIDDRYFPRGLKLKAGDAVLDVGGHHGLFAMELSARFPGVRISCVEPDPEGVELIRKHIRKNHNGGTVRVFPWAIGQDGADGFLTDNNDGSWGKTLELEEKEDSMRVPVRSLKSLFGEEKPDIKLVKSNCEGGEFDLVPQLLELGLKPQMIILMIHPPRGDSTELIKSLEDHGYVSSLVWDSDINPCWHFNLMQQGGQN